MTSKIEATPPSPPPQPGEGASPLFQLMVRINRLVLKGYSAKTLQALTFVIVNDTAYVVRYDRAVLWNLTKDKPVLMGVSGQSKLNKDAEVTQKWAALVKGIPDIQKPQQLTAEQFGPQRQLWNELQKQTKSSVIWLPMFVEDKLIGGLWLERWETEGDKSSPEVLDLLSNFLMKGYGASWDKLSQGFSLRKLGLDKFKLLLGTTALLLLLFLIQVPLRVVAQCEVVPKDPILITAPLDGIVAEVLIHPGDYVNKDQPVFEYDKRAPLHDLKVAQKELQIIQAEVNRAATLGLTEPKSLAELGVLKLKQEKEQVQLDLAEYYASRLTVMAPADGIVMIDNPDEWRGKPVKIGEKVMVISNPNQSKIKIWLPEDDNIVLNPHDEISIFLNVEPEKRRAALLEYIANESSINEKNMTTFIAEANWVNHPADIKLGLKGVAVLYGEDVSLFYYIMRKPWASLRNLLGI